MDHDFKDELRCYKLLKKRYPADKFLWIFNRPLPYEVKTPAGKGTSQPDITVLDRNGLTVVAVIELKWITAERIERLLAYKVPLHLVTTDGGTRLIVSLGEKTSYGVAAKRSHGRKLKYTLPIYSNELVLGRQLPECLRELTRKEKSRKRK